MRKLRTNRAFSMGDLLMVAAAIVGMCLVFLPWLARQRYSSCRISCTNSLKQVGIAFRGWSMDWGDQLPMSVSVSNNGAMELAATGSAYQVFLMMSNDLVSPKILFCPEESKRGRVMANAWSQPVYGAPNSVGFGPGSLSFFLGIDADQAEPQRLLSGDDHLQVAKRRPAPGLLLLSSNAPVKWRKERHNGQGNLLFSDASVQTASSSSFQHLLVQTGQATNRLAMP